MTTPQILNPDRILIEEESFIAVKKFPGELVVSDRWKIEDNILLNWVGEYLRCNGHKPDASGRDLYPVHRLDRETSGIVLFAKNQEAHRELGKIFENRQAKKCYVSLIAGAPLWDSATCRVPIARAEGKKGRGRALVDLKRGKPSETFFIKKKAFGDISWIEAFPHTGRLHQIRIHLRSLGHPLLFDEAYGEQGWKSRFHPNLQSTRHFLHAKSLHFPHPFENRQVEVECPMMEDMRKIYNHLINSSR